MTENVKQQDFTERKIVNQRPKPDLETGPSKEAATFFHTHYQQLQKHSKWKMKLRQGMCKITSFIRRVFVILIVTFASIDLNYAVCIFGVGPQKVMDTDHLRL